MPVSISLAEDYKTSAELLNTLFETLGEEYDQYYNTMSKTSRDAIQAGLADWNAWYFGNWDEWGSSEAWKPVYEKMVSLIDAEKNKGAVKETPINLPPPPVVIPLPPLQIYGRVPKLDYEIPEYEYEVVELEPIKPAWGWILGITIGTIVLYKYAKKK